MRLYFSKSFLLILLTLSFVWIRSGAEKILTHNFPATLVPTLSKLMAKNPYPWYKTFIASTVVPHGSTFGMLVQYGEFLTGLGIALSVVALFAKKHELFSLSVLVLLFSTLVGLFLSLNFYFAAGWTGPSTEGLNLLMAMIEAVAFVSIFYKYFIAKR